MRKIAKLLLVVFLVVSLTGCGEDLVETKTCTKQMDGYVSTYKWIATNDNITDVYLTIVYDNSIFNVDSLASLDDATKEQVKVNMLNSLGLSDVDHEGLDIDIVIEDQMTIYLKAVLDKAAAEVLQKVGMDYKTGTNRSFKTAIAASENDGYTCK